MKKNTSPLIPTTIITFRRKKYYAAGGISLIACGIALLFLPEDAAMMKYPLIAVTVITGILALLSFTVSRIDADDEKIAYRNLFGRVRQLRWKDVRQVMDGIDMDRNMLLFGEHTNIKITSGFDRFEALRGLILRKTQ